MTNRASAYACVSAGIIIAVVAISAHAQFAPPAGYDDGGSQPGVAVSSDASAPPLIRIPDTAVSSVTDVDANYRRHWNPKFDITLPKDVMSESLKGRCWPRLALVSYVTEGRLWFEDIYGLPDGYAQNHCLKEELSKINSDLNKSYKVLLQALDAIDRRRAIASERLWIIQRNKICDVRDGVSYGVLGDFVCLMNVTSDRLGWIASRQLKADTTKSNVR